MIDTVSNAADFFPLHDKGDEFIAEAYGPTFMFGGYALGLAVLAAGRRSAEDMVPKSLHASFLRPGRVEVPLRITVRAMSEGRSIAVHHVELSQDDRPIVTASVSLHRPVGELDWQRPTTHSVPSDPASLPVHEQGLPKPWLMEVHSENADAGMNGSMHPYWARVPGEIDSPLLHATSIAFLSDYFVITSILKADAVIPAPHGLRTLEQSLWFHRPTDARRWHRFDTNPTSIAGGRGLTAGEIHRDDNSLVASFVQQVIVPE